jgi:hypothetical protein
MSISFSEDASHQRPVRTGLKRRTLPAYTKSRQTLSTVISESVSPSFAHDAQACFHQLLGKRVDPCATQWLLESSKSEAETGVAGLIEDWGSNQHRFIT